MSEIAAVVGAGGFVGRHLVSCLKETGHTPVAIVRNPERARKALPDPQLEMRQGDVTDPDSLRAALKGCEVVFNAAAIAATSYVNLEPDLAGHVRVNADGIRNVLLAAQEVGARRVILIGTCVSRFESDGGLVTEDSPMLPASVMDDAYVRSKLMAENIAADFARETNLEIVTLLPGGLIGPNDSEPSVQGKGLLLDRANLKPAAQITIEGAFPVVDVRDVARAGVKALHPGCPARPYLLVAETITIRAWSDLLLRVAGIPMPRLFVPANLALSMATMAEKAAERSHEQPKFTRNMVRQLTLNQRYDCSRAQRELGLTFTPLVQTVLDALRWWIAQGYVQHPERLSIQQGMSVPS